MRVTVVGLGKVGRELARYLVHLGHHVTGLDIVQVFDAGTGFTATMSPAVAYENAEAAVLIVPTPQVGDRLSSECIRKAGEEARRLMPKGTHLLIASTLDPRDAAGVCGQLDAIYTPIFIRLGSVFEDLQSQKFLLIGTHKPSIHPEAATKLWGWWDRAGRMELDLQIVVSDPTTIACAKLAINATLSSRIAWANDVAVRAKAFGADPAVVCKVLGMDPRIGPAFLSPGFPPGGPCVAPGTRVLTPLGGKPIEEIEVGDKVLAHDGRFHRVTRLHSRRYVGAVIRLRSWGGQDVIITPDHPILAFPRPFKSVSRFANNHICPPAAAIGEPRWLPAGDLRSGDYTATPVLKIQESPPAPLRPWPAHSEVSRAEEVPVTEDLARLIGLYISEGFSAGKSARGHAVFAFHKREESLIKDVLETSATHFGASGRVRDHSKNCVHVEVYGPMIGRCLQNLVGRGAANKHLPSGALEWPRAIRRQLLRGIFLGDGSFAGERFAWATISQRLFEEVRLLLLAEGCSFSTRKAEGRTGKDGTRHRDSFYIRAGRGNGLTELRDIVAGGSSPSGLMFKRMQRVGDFLFSPVWKHESQPYDANVHNLEVEGAESYVLSAGLAVHNCLPRDLDVWLSAPGQGMAEAVLVSHRITRQRILAQIMEALKARPIRTVLVIGLTYKEGGLDWTDALGIAVVKECAKQGYEVFGYDREGTPADALEKMGARRMEADQPFWADAIVVGMPGYPEELAHIGWEIDALVINPWR